MSYDSQVIYGDSPNKKSFPLNGYIYYTTKKGITKKCKTSRPMKEAVKVSQVEYDKAWAECYRLLYA